MVDNVNMVDIINMVDMVDMSVMDLFSRKGTVSRDFNRPILVSKERS